MDVIEHALRSRRGRFIVRASVTSTAEYTHDCSIRLMNANDGRTMRIRDKHRIDVKSCDITWYARDRIIPITQSLHLLPYSYDHIAS